MTRPERFGSGPLVRVRHYRYIRATVSGPSRRSIGFGDAAVRVRSAARRPAGVLGPIVLGVLFAAVVLVCLDAIIQPHGLPWRPGRYAVSAPDVVPSRLDPPAKPVVPPDPDPQDWGESEDWASNPETEPLSPVAEVLGEIEAGIRAVALVVGIVLFLVVVLFHFAPFLCLGIAAGGWLLGRRIAFEKSGKYRRTLP